MMGKKSAKKKIKKSIFVINLPTMLFNVAGVVVVVVVSGCDGDLRISIDEDCVIVGGGGCKFCNKFLNCSPLSS